MHESRSAVPGRTDFDDHSPNRHCRPPVCRGEDRPIAGRAPAAIAPDGHTGDPALDDDQRLRPGVRLSPPGTDSGETR